ncbi:unnamed protein product [Ilex paraguariensis]|uniref:Uncharacterized protein n=1 Tax=Ilex paraguariensis TaxID=185542 RepID=A0ABC8SPG6_9AQUA
MRHQWFILLYIFTALWFRISRFLRCLQKNIYSFVEGSKNNLVDYCCCGYSASIYCGQCDKYEYLSSSCIFVNAGILCRLYLAFKLTLFG